MLCFSYTELVLWPLHEIGARTEFKRHQNLFLNEYSMSIVYTAAGVAVQCQ